MVITFLTMYVKSQFFYNTHGNYKNINLLAKNKYKKSLLMYNKILSKKMIMVLRLCLLGKFLLTMWSQKYVFDHCNQSMGSGPNWKQNSMLTDLKVSSLVRKCVFCARSELTGKWDSMELKLSF